MDDFFDKIKGKVDRGITTITSKSKEALELVRLRSDLRTLDNKKEEEIKELGSLAYQLLNEDRLEPEKLKEFHSSLKEIDTRILNIQEREKVLKVAFERHPNQRLSGLTNHRRMKVIR